MRQEMQNAQARPIAKALINLNKIGHGNSAAPRSISGFNPTFGLGQTIGVLLPQTNLQHIADEERGIDRILRNRAVLVFHFHLHLIMRQHLPSELQNPGKRPRIEPMLHIIRHMNLEQTSFRPLMQRPSAIYEPLRDITDLGDVIMGRDEVPVWQDKAWLCLEILTQHPV